jgi:hypothetical protein
VTNQLSSLALTLALDLQLVILPLIHEEAIDIANYGEWSDFVIGEFRASERGPQWT